VKLKENLKIIGKNYQLVYSLALMILIPAAIIVNTIIFTNSFKKSIDQELYNKTIALGQVINATSLEVLNQPEALQTQVETIAKFNDEIKSLDVLQKNGEDFRVIASLDKTALGTTTQGMQYLIAWHQNQPIAYLTSSQANTTVKQEVSFAKDYERFWVVTMPLKDSLGAKQALLSMKVSLQVMDNLTRDILLRSYFILALTILVIILLLANNARLFEYATLYRKLQEVDQMKDEFISMASHELRTPVTGIRGYVSMMIEGSLGPVSDKARDSLKIVQSAADRLATLVEDLLNVSRIEQGRMKIEAKPIELGAIIKEIVSELKVQADEKKLALEFKPHATTLPLVNLDIDRIKQVLINLIGNAIKYTIKGGVEVATEEKETGKILEIRIKDTGIGMSAKDRERLFQKFYRVQNDKTKNIAGTGLGLWITKQIVELMHGQIMVDSIENVGTQITLNFPIVKNS